jgi:hypothetical protein
LQQDGKSLVCIARLAEITVAGRYMGVIILHDISELRRLLETVTLIFEKATTPMIMIGTKPRLYACDKLNLSSRRITIHRAQALGQQLFASVFALDRLWFSE